MDENKIVILSLNFRTPVDDIYKVFSRYGVITECHLLVNDNNESKGYAFVTYEDNKSAQYAIQEMDGRSFEGRNIKVVWAEKRDREPRHYHDNAEQLDEHVKNLLDQDFKFASRQKSDALL
ncbi:RNA-binding protein [Histomonas meleagridis]|uniref:RNA-binding protein n=1 Tax=Histomonas meleagridis TaxID=135588 RepID=UPI003559A87A|nr:RNA-binding protein [Histomonas meleagridis]KAH0805944.1 RNA-binding protein [Histomonas meleagridis]